jgi:hypothetical protein
VLLSVIGRSRNVYDLIVRDQCDKSILIEPNRSTSRNVNAPLVESGYDSDKQSVLVDDVEIVEARKRVIPSEVGLYCPEGVLRARAHLCYFSLADGRCITLSSSADREIGILVGRSATGFDELPGEMIQRGSQIMDCVSNDETDFIWDGINGFDVEGCVLNLGYCVRPSSNCIGLRVAKKPNPLVQIEDVLLGPLNFKPNSVNAVDACHRCEYESRSKNGALPDKPMRVRYFLGRQACGSWPSDETSRKCCDPGYVCSKILISKEKS